MSMVSFIVYCSWNMGHVRYIYHNSPPKCEPWWWSVWRCWWQCCKLYNWTLDPLGTGDWAVRCLPRDQCLSLVTNCLMWPSEECAKHCKARQLISNTTPWPTVHYLGLVPPIWVGAKYLIFVHRPPPLITRPPPGPIIDPPVTSTRRRPGCLVPCWGGHDVFTALVSTGG